jgi:hypothetical protein
MDSSARRHAALGRVSLRFLAGAALALLAAAPGLALGSAVGLSAVPGMPEGRPSFRFFGSEQGLPQSSPQAFALDARGLLWTGTQDGAAVYNGRFWKTVDMPNREESNNVTDILSGGTARCGSPPPSASPVCTTAGGPCFARPRACPPTGS